MNPHRTTNPAIRASHIADREQKLHEQQLIEQMWFDSSILTPYRDWPTYWLKSYENTLPLLVELPEKN